MLTRSGVAACRSPASRFPPPTASAIAWRLGFCDSPSRGGVIALGARASRPHPFPLAAAELQCNASGSHPVGEPPCGREPHRPGRRKAMASFPVDPSGGDGRGCGRLCAGGTPALPGSRHPHIRPGTWFTSCQAIGQEALCKPEESLPPWRGSRQDKGVARRRAGGG